MGREEYGEGKELLMILSIPPHQWSMVVVVSWRGHVWLPVETGSLVFIDDVTADKSSRMNSEVFRAILSAHIQPNASELIGRRFTVQMDNDPKHTAKSNQRVFEGKEVDCYAMAKSITWPESDWACISLAEDKTEGKMPQEQAGTEDVAVEAWQSITRDETQRLVMSMRSRLQAEIDCKGFEPSIKKWKFDYAYYSVPLLLVP